VSQVPRAGILGVGMAVPDRILSNEDLTRMVETSDEWIVTRTGIRERRIMAPTETTSQFAVRAARAAMADAGVTPADIDMIIVCTYTADRLCPSAACVVHKELGFKDIPAFDLNAACSGFMYGLQMANALIRSGIHKRVLVVGAEGQSRFADYTDRTTCILFGDGAGAVVAGASEDDPERGILSCILGADGGGNEMITLNAAHPPGGPHLDGEYPVRDPYIRMNGREVFKFAVRGIERALDLALAQAGLPASAVDLLIPHQANDRIIEAAATRLNLPPERVLKNIDRYGNTAAASIPIALCEAHQTGRLKRGQVAALVGFGGGFTFGSTIIRW
jgi:3-oxoacyl-[acyl-carrier-protein] synthase-3